MDGRLLSFYAENVTKSEGDRLKWVIEKFGKYMDKFFNEKIKLGALGELFILCNLVPDLENKYGIEVYDMMAYKTQRRLIPEFSGKLLDILRGLIRV